MSLNETFSFLLFQHSGDFQDVYNLQMKMLGIFCVKSNLHLNFEIKLKEQLK